MSEVRAVDWTGTEISLMRPAKRIICLTAAGLDGIRMLSLTLDQLMPIIYPEFLTSEPLHVGGDI